jgi:hypothetical protein
MNFGCPSDDGPLRPVLNFQVRTPSALTAGPSSSLRIRESGTYTYHSRFISEGVAETSQVFLQPHFTKMT